MASSEPASLRELYSAALDLRQQLESLSSTSERYHETLKVALDRLQTCRHLADSVSLFSPNEAFDDIATPGLPYLSIDYHLGDLTSQQPSNDPSTHDPSARKATLHAAQSHYATFLYRLDTYELLTKSDQGLHERFTDAPDRFSLLEQADAQRKRAAKIARHKQEQDLEARLAQLRHDPTALSSDDGALRTLRRAELDLHAHRTFHALDQIAQELAILALAPTDPPAPADGAAADARHRLRDGLNGDTYSDRLDPSLAQLMQGGRGGPLLSKDGKPLRPFTLLDSRQRLRSGVFRPDHNLPTMSIDEYLEVERHRGGIVDGGGAESGRRASVDEDDLDAADRETMKAREWDEFKEANPKGSGNTLNRG